MRDTLFPILNAYIAKIPDKVPVIEQIYSQQRRDEIANVKNTVVRREKYYAWKLLQYAAHDALGIDIRNVSFEKSHTGKWLCDSFEFSISHSDGVVAVAISDSCVGIDVQFLSSVRGRRFAEKILNKGEMNEYNACDENEREVLLIKKWSQKESIFKSLNLPCYTAAEIDTNAYTIRDKMLMISEKAYYLSVFGGSIEMLKIYTDIVL